MLTGRRLAGEREGNLALRVDLVDADLNFLAQGDDVLDALHSATLAEA
jgi:hypothetical protein